MNKVEETLEYLLDVAIERFGYAARVVFFFSSLIRLGFDHQELRNAFNINLKINIEWC